MLMINTIIAIAITGKMESDKTRLISSSETGKEEILSLSIKNNEITNIVETLIINPVKAIISRICRL